MPSQTDLTAGSFAFKLVGNIISGNRAAAQQYQQYAQQMQQQKFAYDRNTADNKAIAEANLTNTIRTGFRVGILNVQRAQAKKKAIQDGFDVSVTRQQALGAANANAAAAGTIGSSVDAVANDIEQRVGQATNNIATNFEQTEVNFDTQLQDMLWSAQDALRSPEKIDMITPTMPSGFSWGEAIAGAAIDVGADYASAAMKLGLGKPAGG